MKCLKLYQIYVLLCPGNANDTTIIVNKTNGIASETTNISSKVGRITSKMLVIDAHYLSINLFKRMYFILNWKFKTIVLDRFKLFLFNCQIERKFSIC